MRRKLAASAAVLGILIVLLIVGCSIEREFEPADEIVTIRLWDGFLQGGSEEMNATASYYNEKIAEKFPNLKIVRESPISGADYLTTYDLALMAGTAPAAYANVPYVDVPQRMENGTVADITALYGTWEHKNKMLDYFDEAISKDGRQYAIVRSAYFMGTSYNKRLLSEQGVSEESMPETWEEFGALGQRITDKSVPRYGYELIGMDFNAWPFTAWVWSSGGEMVRKNGSKYTIAFNEPEGVDAAVFMNEMVWKYRMTQDSVLQGMDMNEKDIKSGKAAFFWSDLNNYNNADLKKYGNLTLDDFGIMPMPIKNESVSPTGFAGGEVIIFNPRISREELNAAFEYMSYVYYDEDYLTGLWQLSNEMGTGSIQVPARKDLYDKMLGIFTKVPKTLKDDMLEISKIAKAEPFCPHWNDLKNALAKPLQEIMMDENLTREKAQQLLDDCAQYLCSKYPDTFER